MTKFAPNTDIIKEELGVNMNNYKIDELKLYIDKTEVIKINEDLKIRLSKDLLSNYENGLYDKGIENIVFAIDEIKKLNIKYPSNAKPVYYVYIVPDDSFVTLLNFPTSRSTKGGGKIVNCYDLDGFSSAYGVSSNIMLRQNDANIMEKVNDIHEMAHMVHNMFYSRDRYLCEGFAEVLPLYMLGYEKKFRQHHECILSLTEKDILTVQELLDLEEKNEFVGSSLLPNASCSFDKAYVSSYLFVRGCINVIEEKFKINKMEAMNKFLEIIMNSMYMHQFLVFDIASVLGVDREDLLSGKFMQYKAITSIFNEK